MPGQEFAGGSRSPRILPGSYPKSIAQCSEPLRVYLDPTRAREYARGSRAARKSGLGSETGLQARSCLSRVAVSPCNERLHCELDPLTPFIAIFVRAPLCTSTSRKRTWDKSPGVCEGISSRPQIRIRFRNRSSGSIMSVTSIWTRQEATARTRRTLLVSRWRRGRADVQKKKSCEQPSPSRLSDGSRKRLQGGESRNTFQLSPKDAYQSQLFRYRSSPSTARY
jgi:hypothetical protein